MNISQIYITVSVAALAVIACLVFVVSRNKNENRLTPSAGLAFEFVLAGILFGEQRFASYGLIGVGVLLAFIDIFYKSKRK